MAAWQLAKKLNNHIIKLHVVSAPRPYTATGNCFHIGILDFLFQSDSSARLDLPPPLPVLWQLLFCGQLRGRFIPKTEAVYA